MKIFSAKEAEFMEFPERFNRNYADVLKHRIMKKKEHMEFGLKIIETFRLSLMTKKEKEEYDKEQRKYLWRTLIHEAFSKLKDDEKNKEYWNKLFEEENMKKNKVWQSDDNNRIDQINEINMWVNREIVKFYFGEEMLKHEEADAMKR